MPSSPTRVTVSIAPEVVDRHHEVLVGGLLAGGLPEAVRNLADRPEVDLRQELLDRDLRLETLASEPAIADWRAAIAACRLKPSTYKSSPEQLARRTLKSGPVHTGLPLVDLYCEVSTRHLAPLGGYDVSGLPAGDVRLRPANPQGDTFTPLGGKEGELPLTADVIVYASGNVVICWAYNCRDSQQSALSDGTEAALFLGEAVTLPQQRRLRGALTELSGRLQNAGAAVTPTLYAEAAQPSFELISP